MPAQLTILSGKGGTGKTTIAASFLNLAGSAVAADCDVDAPNLHLLLDPVRVSREPFEGAMVACIDPEKCTQCLICEESCPFGAIRDLAVDPFSCEGCGVCELVCQDGAARLVPEMTGEVFVSETRFGPLAHALLRPGGEASGKLVTRVKEVASRLAGERGLDLILVDGSPGIGCPVIASVAGSDLILAVAEPTLSGLWGLERIHGVAKHFGVKMAVCINKGDINPEITEQIRCYCAESELTLLGVIPFDEEVNRATMTGEVLVERYEGPAASAIRGLWEQTMGLLEHARTKA
ncbi:MAG: ATP-binding protein [Actinobacteria bacterium]|nr:ATP-binding protein [Actinomycetota bacterium]MBU1943518.1 ATP-binding protein [Actinomycetota bacterium]MBU2686465.1 ATP-binding protein [Actinomycetota bacterium]